MSDWDVITWIGVLTVLLVILIYSGAASALMGAVGATAPMAVNAIVQPQKGQGHA